MKSEMLDKFFKSITKVQRVVLPRTRGDKYVEITNRYTTHAQDKSTQLVEFEDGTRMRVTVEIVK